tara:strand:+ start:421 stop:669 length:249 start_codon:yes stop_codon:yes gene_type:complete
LSLNQNLAFCKSRLNKINFYNKNKMFYCNFKSSEEKKSFYQRKKLEMLNYIKDSLERKIASVSASIEVLENQISRDNVEINN